MTLNCATLKLCPLICQSSHVTCNIHQRALFHSDQSLKLVIDSCGQSYKHFMLISDDSRVVLTRKVPILYL